MVIKSVATEQCIQIVVDANFSNKLIMLMSFYLD